MKLRESPRIGKWWEGDDVAVGVVEEEEGETEDLVDGNDCNEKGCLGVKLDSGSDGGDNHNRGGDRNSEQFKEEGHGRPLKVSR